MDPAAAMDVQILTRLRAIREAEEQGDSEIQQLYRGAVVFITGGTGFLGKQLLEKLLRSCHEIKSIYLLSRNKKGKTMKERLAKTFEDPVFDQLRKINPGFDEKIMPVEGDILELRLGIKDEDWKTLTKEVNFIYHVAATVLFNEPLKSAIIANVRGTREVLTLAKECYSLKAMVYVSTAFSHCNRKEVAEKFYSSPVPPATMIKMVENMEDCRLDALTPALTESWPNTYTFSKAIAEEMVRVMGEGLPICVVRPAIVAPSLLEPAPGWLDMSNVLGPSGILLGSGIGVIHTLLADNSTELDLVPVDYVNNLIIASSWETVKRFQREEKDIKIYTSSRIRNKLRWGAGRDIIENYGTLYRSPKIVWHPFICSSPNRHVYLFLTIFIHFIPALFLDMILMVIGQKLRLGRIYRKVYRLNTVLSYFLLKTWEFSDDNTLDLKNSLSETDKKIFHFDIADIDHKTFLMIWLLGLRKYVLKDGLRGTNIAIKRAAYLRFAHYLVTALYFLFLWKVLSWSVIIFWFCFSYGYMLTHKIV